MTIERVLIAGASGKTGRELLDYCLDAGLTVRASTTTPERVESLEIQGAHEVVVGDLLDPVDCRDLVDGVDAVLCAVGAGPSLSMLTGPVVDGEGVVNLVDAAVAAGVERFVLMSSIGVGDSRSGMPLPFRLAIKPVLKAKDRGETHLRESGLPFVVVRPGGLTDGPATGDVLVGEGGESVTGMVSRADVARVMVAALFTDDATDRTFELVSRSGSRGEAENLVDVEWVLPGESAEPLV